MGISAKLGEAGDAIHASVIEPSLEYMEDVGVTDVVARTGKHAEVLYGNIRFATKPYFEPEDVRELLLNTRKELIYITACVLQISPQKAENWLGEFGKLLTAKMAGVLGTGTLFGLVSTFGTAGTGTAIASLSGAAATNATLAWVGGLLGGGMATGAILTAGVGVVVGVAAYKLFGSTARSFDELKEVDRGIVETAGALVAILDELLARHTIDLGGEEAQLFLENTLIPYHKALVDGEDDICSRLDAKNAIAYRQHVLRDFEPVVLAGFGYFFEQSEFKSESIIGGVIYALLSRTALDGSEKEQTVLDALRRSKNELNDASELDLANYLADQSPEQLQGIANNVKGIYHEMRWVNDYNSEPGESFARIMGATNHPGFDVEIVDSSSGNVITRYQHKATDASGAIRDFQEKNPDIDVLATSEAAARMEGIESSGFSNLELTGEVGGVFDAVEDNTIEAQIIKYAGLVGLAAAGREAIAVLQGKATPSEAAEGSLSSIIQAATATGLTAYLFS